jgi:hypothetical protein
MARRELPDTVAFIWAQTEGRLQEQIRDAESLDSTSSGAWASSRC